MLRVCMAAIGTDQYSAIQPNNAKRKAKKWNTLQKANKFPDLYLSKAAFQLPMTKLKAEMPTNKQPMKAAPVKTWQLQGGNSESSDVHRL